jgi:DHA1 family multidrug resistance protein-like MFS transporter
MVQANMSAYVVAVESLLRLFQLMTEPVVLYVNVYLALAYAIFYRELSRPPAR